MSLFVNTFQADHQKHKCRSPVKQKNTSRPLNAFMFYRKEKTENMQTDWMKLHQSQLSALIGEMWKRENEDVKLKYYRMAEEAALAHLQKHPGYKYSPKQRRKNKAPEAKVIGSPKVTKCKQTEAKQKEKNQTVSHSVKASTIPESPDHTNSLDISDFIDPNTLEFRLDAFNFVDDPLPPSDLVHEENLFPESLNTDMLTRILLVQQFC
uniref:Sex Minus n=1 Tax=Blakeslea trispora TaxID=4850 RepID=W9AAG9_BLATR|nr:Sex Minus [Blakeslea trispora]